MVLFFSMFFLLKSAYSLTGCFFDQQFPDVCSLSNNVLTLNQLNGNHLLDFSPESAPPWASPGKCSITQVKFTGLTTYIGKYAFAGCNKLETINMDGSMGPITTIAAYAFYNCTKLNFPMSNYFSEVQEYAFAYCKFQLIYGFSFTSLGDFSFSYCTNIIKFLISSKLETISPTTFVGSSNIEEFYTQDTSSKTFTASDGVLLSKDEKKIVLYPPAKKGNSYKIL